MHSVMKSDYLVGGYKKVLEEDTSPQVALIGTDACILGFVAQQRV